MNIKKTDLAAVLSKGVLGGIPFIGPMMAEIVGVTIPNQRIDRIESMLEILESKITDGEKERIPLKINSEESIDLLEDSFIQTSRALSEERKEYIASLLKNSLTDDKLEHIEYKRLLSILGELNDVEIIILKSFVFRKGSEKGNLFWDKHKHILYRPLLTRTAPQDMVDKELIYDTHTAHMVRLGLLRINFRKPTRGELPKFDVNTGMIAAQSYDITELGILLLRSIDQYN